MALGFGSLGERPQAAAGQGASSSKSYPSKDRKRGSWQQQVTEESPQRESLSDSIEDEPPGMPNQDRHPLEAGAIRPKPKWPGIHRDPDKLDGLVFVGGKTGRPPPIYSQGITGKDQVKKNGFQTMEFSENCWCSLSKNSSIFEKIREIGKGPAYFPAWYVRFREPEVLFIHVAGHLRIAKSVKFGRICILKF